MNSENVRREGSTTRDDARVDETKVFSDLFPKIKERKKVFFPLFVCLFVCLTEEFISDD